MRTTAVMEVPIYGLAETAQYLHAPHNSNHCYA